MQNNNKFVDRFGRKERTGLGGRSRVGDSIDDSTEVIRQRLLDELSELREHHESLQRQRVEDGPWLPHREDGRFDPDLFGNNSLPRDREEETTLRHLGDGDKDAIEALFASDDFAEMFNAGAGHVSRLQPMRAPQEIRQPPVRNTNRGQPQSHQSSVVPICHLCAKRLAPSEIAAYVSKSFDPTKPTSRRRLQK